MANNPNPTPNHDFPQPSKGSLDGTWGDTVNDELTQRLEERVEIRDVQSNLGNYTPYEDAAFRATDTGRIYLGDGNGWNAQNFGTSDDPVPGTSHFEALEAEQVTSGSLPTWRVYQDGNKTVAVNSSDTEIDRSTDASQVFQSVFDKAYSLFDPSYPNQPVAVVDGGMLEYEITSSVDVKDGVILQNCRFDGSAASGTFTIGAPDDGFLHRAIDVHNLIFRDFSEPVVFDDLSNSKVSSVKVLNSTAANRAALFNGPITCEIDIDIIDSSADGIQFENKGATGYDGNSNEIYVRVIGSDDSNIVNRTAKNTRFFAVSDGAGRDGIVDSGQGNTYISPNVEASSNFGMLINGTRINVISPAGYRNGNDDYRGSSSSEDCRIVGPTRVDDDGITSGASTNFVVENVREEKIGSINGDRSVINGRIVNRETLSLGGSDGVVAPADVATPVVEFEVEGGGSASELEGVDGVLRRAGQTIRIVKAGADDITLVHNDTSATDPLVNKSGTNVTMTRIGDMAEYTYSTQNSKWIMTGGPTTQ